MPTPPDQPNPEDICPRHIRQTNAPLETTHPHSTPIWLSTVYECGTPSETDAMLGGQTAGYVYSRDGHPNAALLAEKCRQLHRAEKAIVTNSGMSALALALVTQCQAGDHVIVSKHLYGRTVTLICNEAKRLGIAATLVDTFNDAELAKAWQAKTRLLVVESITNPLLRVSNLPQLAKQAHEHNAKFLVDNTLASPTNCRPLEHGADLVLESLTKIMNGHSDSLLGLLCGRADCWERVSAACSSWGWTAAPFESWLTDRGLSTLAIRWQQVADNAIAVAQFLQQQPKIKTVHYAGLPDHADFAVAKKIFTPKSIVANEKSIRSGTLVAFSVLGGWDGATRFIAALRDTIPFCPSLGELNTTLSHPASTSHRAFSSADRQAIGIDDGLIRLSVGTESSKTICENLAAGLAAC